jgi:branched-chain amino acid transport system permease protein
MSSRATSTNLAAAFKDAGFWGLVALGLFLPLIGFHAVQNIRNELVLDTRWPLLAAFVAVVAVGRLVHNLLIAPWLERRRLAARASIDGPGWGSRVADTLVAGLSYLVPFVPAAEIVRIAALFFRQSPIAFALLYPAVAIWIAGPGGAVKWIDNFGVQILIYVMLGFGLNIVVGLAGLLDLGYVAFYAVGAYSYALLSQTFGLSFFALLPLAGILAAFWGLLLGFPVLRLRGDYLAIVTMAFGEIIRLVLVNWGPVTGGYAGITGIPRPTFFGIPFNASDEGFAATISSALPRFLRLFGFDPSDEGFAARFSLTFSPIHRLMFLYYIILALALLTAFVTMRLRRLPVGRAWEALREDEIACRSLGINTTNTKLTAFAIGAGFGGFAGAFFAARQGFISPESFTFMESATILAIVVLGGMGSTIGVAIAAIAMIGGTEALRELDVLKEFFGNDFDPTQYRMLLFGFAMVVIMVVRPRGLISTREASVHLTERKKISGALVREGHG